MGVSARRRRYQLWTRSEGAPQAGQATRSAGARAVTRMVRSWRSMCSSRTLVKFGNIVSRRSLHAQHHSSDVPADHRITECVPDPENVSGRASGMSVELAVASRPRNVTAAFTLPRYGDRRLGRAGDSRTRRKPWAAVEQV